MWKKLNAAWKINLGIKKDLIIELDGGQHGERRNEDQKRTDYLNAQGFRVIRFWDHEVFTMTQNILEMIRLELETPHPNPLPEGEGTHDSKIYRFLSPFGKGLRVRGEL